MRGDKLGLYSARPFNNKDKTKENLKSTVLDARALPEKMRHIMVSTVMFPVGSAEGWGVKDSGGAHGDVGSPRF